MTSVRTFFVTGLLFGIFASTVAAQDSTRYAKTPNALRPYKDFQTPYKVFFVEPQAFRGPGRDVGPPPDLDTVRIGVLAPLEGSRDAKWGQRVVRGATMAIDEANAAGGFDGLPFAVVTRNDLGLWGASGNELVALYDRGVWATVGSIDGANSHIMVRLALKLDMPIVNTATTDPTLTETAVPWIIRCIADDRQASYALALYMHEVRGFRRVALLRANDRYGRVGTGELVDALRRLGAPVVLELRYAPGSGDVQPQLARIEQANADAVVLWGDGRDAGDIVRRMREMGLDQPVLGPDRLVSNEFLTTAGDAAEGVVATYPFNPEGEDPMYRRFAERYADRFGETPDAYAAHAYDGMRMVIQSIHKAGLNRVRIRDALTDMPSFQGVTGSIPFDATWNDVGPVWMAVVQNGTYSFFPSPLDDEHNAIER